MKVDIEVLNVPAGELEGYMVARLVGGQLWYYGIYDDLDRASDVASEFDNGLVVTRLRKYKMGETYWASNEKAGINMQSCGELVGWTDDGLAILWNKRWGKIYATKKNLDEHN